MLQLDQISFYGCSNIYLVGLTDKCAVAMIDMCVVQKFRSETRNRSDDRQCDADDVSLHF